MQLPVQINKETFEAMHADMQACYATDGETFKLALKPVQYDSGQKSEDVLRLSRVREAAGKVLHRQLVSDALTAANLPADKLKGVMAQTKCSLNGDGLAEVLVSDAVTGFRISAKPDVAGLMSIDEFVETLKPSNPDAGSGGGASAGKTPDTIVEERKVGNDIIQRLACGRVLVNGVPAEQISGQRLMGLSDRPQVAQPGPNVRLTAKQAEGLSGPQLMGAARGLGITTAAKPMQVSGTTV